MYKTALVLSLALSGCAAPGYRAPELPVPAAFRETRDTIIETPVTLTALPDTVSALDVSDTTLARLLNEAVRANLDVRAAEARVRGARAARREVTFDLAPTVTFGVGYTRQRLSSATFPVGFESRCRV